MTASNTPIISHRPEANDFAETVASIAKDVQQRFRNDPQDTIAYLELLEELRQFPLGQFLIVNKGLNGFWTDYIVSHPFQPKQPANDVEGFLLNKAPSLLATQQRFQIFQAQLQMRLKSQMTLCSVPCGLMRDLTGLNYEGLYNVRLVGVGVDLDQDSLSQASSKHLGQAVTCQLVHANAWDMPLDACVDVLTSNGLNIYEPDSQRRHALFLSFHKALKNGGVLISSFLTPPPTINPKSPWIMDHIHVPDLHKQKRIFGDVLGVAWQNYTLPEEMHEQLTACGFEDIKFHYDNARIFPTVTAMKTCR